jgi:hypothetical protein
VVGGGLPAVGRAGDRRRTAAGRFRRAGKGRNGRGRCSGVRGNYGCSQFGEEKSGKASSTATRASRRRQWRSGGSVRARGAPGGLFIDKRGNGGSLVP